MGRMARVIRMKRVTVNTNDGVTWLTAVRRYENAMQDEHSHITMLSHIAMYSHTAMYSAIAMYSHIAIYSHIWPCIVT